MKNREGTAEHKHNARTAKRRAKAALRRGDYEGIYTPKTHNQKGYAPS